MNLRRQRPQQGGRGNRKHLSKRGLPAMKRFILVLPAHMDVSLHLFRGGYRR